MAEVKKGRQTPTVSYVLPYSESLGEKAIDEYEQTGRTAQEWQDGIINDIMSVLPDGLWCHTKFGYSVPRRNGKNEVVSIRELYGLKNGERILHTAHRTTTSHSAALRLAKLLDDQGYTEVQRTNKEKKYNKSYSFSKQFGLERIHILDEGGGSCDFRTRTAKGGLGEGFDLLIIDEAQEYTRDQESSLKYVVTDSKNPQTLFCGTPPTAVSGGDVFPLMRKNVLEGITKNTGWAEWSVEKQCDPTDVEAWYMTNPSLGTIFTERSINDEIGSDIIDFNIQRLGLWVTYDQKSEITQADWASTETTRKPSLTGKIYIGIKFGKDGTNVALAVACKTTQGRVFVSAYDCRNQREGIAWLVDFLKRAPSIGGVAIDGQNGVEMMQKAMKEAHLKAPVIPTVKEIIAANADFEQAVFNDGLRHMMQPSLDDAVTHCEKRAIGTNGGFGYKSTNESYEIALLDSVILAHWLCSAAKERKRQTIRY